MSKSASFFTKNVIDVLVHTYSRGSISNEAFERRLDKVIEMTSHQAMMDQIADLDATPNEDTLTYALENIN
ncbi:hypothetical protein BAE46_03785 [Glaciecola punicea]|jgi:hypothetical protein|uniref:hypothetical protein n=1 Tax=Glaciecola punicea TaxID=56804 RepID=UPI0008724567|nr:hypothetical protein [Glaciecola punicea]OFA32876.1 hypothetical protein BAE46_03785 [Glaciecola punicea]